MAHLFLALGITAEVLGTPLLKHTHGFSRLWPSVGSLGMYGVAFVLLAQALRDILVGVAYATWSGRGTAAIVAIGAVFFGEPLTAARAAGIALVIAGIVLLNLGGAH